MSLAFLFKKTWHPSTLQNSERVWIAEQKDAAEKRRIEELTKQVREEQQVRELEEMQAAGGHGPDKKERIDWMYEGPMQSAQEQQAEADEYLMGKEFKMKDKGTSELKNMEESKAPGTLFTAAPATSANEAFRRVQEDPLLRMRKARIEAEQSVANNPVKMSKIRHQLEAELAAKAEKKRANKEAKKAKKDAKKERRKEKKDKGKNGNKYSSSSEDDGSKQRGMGGNSYSNSNGKYGDVTRNRTADHEDSNRYGRSQPPSYAETGHTSRERHHRDSPPPHSDHARSDRRRNDSRTCAFEAATRQSRWGNHDAGAREDDNNRGRSRRENVKTERNAKRYASNGDHHRHDNDDHDHSSMHGRSYHNESGRAGGRGGGGRERGEIRRSGEEGGRGDWSASTGHRNSGGGGDGGGAGGGGRGNDNRTHAREGGRGAGSRDKVGGVDFSRGRRAGSDDDVDELRQREHERNRKNTPRGGGVRGGSGGMEKDRHRDRDTGVLKTNKSESPTRQHRKRERSIEREESGEEGHGRREGDRKHSRSRTNSPVRPTPTPAAAAGVPAGGKRYGLLGGVSSSLSGGGKGGHTSLGPAAALLEAKEKERSERERGRADARRRRVMTPEEKMQRLREMEDDGTRNQELKKQRVEQGKRTDTRSGDGGKGQSTSTASFVDKLRGEQMDNMGLEERMQRNRHYQQRGADVHNFMARG